MIRMRAALMGKEGKMKGMLAACTPIRHSLKPDSELIYSLFPFHLITVSAILFHSQFLSFFFI